MNKKESLEQLELEASIYQTWENSGAFSAQVNSTKTPHTIMIPPPNLTGSLHVGHALTMTLQDILTRWKRMQGRDALWLPGTDHAGIATQMVVERQLREKGLSKTDLGREEFLCRVWEWKKESGGSITQQLRRLGASLDWKRERFTMDEGMSTAVREAFIRLYNAGLIYRDRRLVNWDPKFQSAISDLEVENRDSKGSLWYIRYPLADFKDKYVVIATTRPETMLADCALAVNPSDIRYQALIGKKVFIPLVGRKIPIIADDYSDPEKGSGVVKITPAHDFNDFNVGQRHSLPMYSILDSSARINIESIKENFFKIDTIADPEFVRSLVGRDPFEARKIIINELDKLNLLEKVEPHVSQIPYAERGDTIIEPMLTTQWFCNAAELGKAAIAAVRSGEVQFSPKQWENNFFAWMSDLQPWCISRQIWWGHRIPAWYGPDGKVFVCHTETEALKMSEDFYKERVVLKQDDDVLDTWFSSSLWPFATLGWPNNTPDLTRYYPGDILVTGFDIIFFWVARMMMMGIYFMNQVPFRKVIIHGLVRDEQGQKMSKSKGNVIDPLALMDQYGVDSLRWTICFHTGPGRDIKLGKTSVEAGSKFITKLNSAANFLRICNIQPDKNFDPTSVDMPLAKWLLWKTNSAVDDATNSLNASRFDDYANSIYRFFWLTYCDWFIELAKFNLKDPNHREIRASAAYVFGVTLRLLNPITPFVTEELWHKLNYGPLCSLISESWPMASIIDDSNEALTEIDWLIQFITAIRTVRAEVNIPYSVFPPVYLFEATSQSFDRINRWKDTVIRLACISDINILQETIPNGAAQTHVPDATIIIPLAGIIDIKAEKARLIKEQEKAQTNYRKYSDKLHDNKFLTCAPSAVIEKTRNLLEKTQFDLNRLNEALNRLSS